MYKCFHCTSSSVIWDADHSLDEMYGEGEGIVHLCHCTNCGAEIIYIIRFDGNEECDR
jgi:hypothetical protein